MPIYYNLWPHKIIELINFLQKTIENIKVCLWNTDYAPGGNKVQKSYF